MSSFDHMDRARTFMARKRPNVRHYQDDFVDYDAGRYAPVADSTIRADVYRWLDTCRKTKTFGKGKRQGGAAGGICAISERT